MRHYIYNQFYYLFSFDCIFIFITIKINYFDLFLLFKNEYFTKEKVRFFA